MEDGFLTTHVLDTALGQPAAGMKITLYAIGDGSPRKVAEMFTNADGRTDTPILPAADFQVGRYELIFHAGDYLRDTQENLPDPLFLDNVPIRFGMADLGAHYHVPLLISPYGYSTYRGS